MPGVLSSVDALKEAYARIERARIAKAKYLDLSSRLRWLRRLPPILQDVPSVETILLSGTAIADIEGLARFPNVKDLNLGWCSIQDFGAVRELRRLEAFQAIGSSVSTIEFHPSAPLIEVVLTNTKLTAVPRLSNPLRLTRLEIDGCPIHSLDDIERYENLEELEIDRTEITSIDKLSQLRKLRRLSMSHTKVASIEPLYDMAALECLNINHTAVTDLTPLATVTQIRDGKGKVHSNGWSLWKAGLEFKNTPLRDRTLRMMADLPDPPRTKHVFDYLHNRSTDIQPSDYDTNEPPVEEEDLPLQQPRGYSFRGSEEIPIQLEAEDSANADAGQQELHQELVSLTSELRAVLSRAGNTFPGLDVDVAAYETALGATLKEASIKSLWSRGSKLRLWLRVDQSRRTTKGTEDPPLDDELFVRMNALVQTHNVFIVGDPLGRECDLNHLGPAGRLAAANAVAAFKPVLEQLEGQTDVIDEAALEALQSTVDAAGFSASDQSIDAQQARAFAFVTLSNFCIELVRKSYISVAKATRGSGPLSVIREGALHRIGELPVDLVALGTIGVAGATVAFVVGSSPAIVNVLVSVPALDPLLQALQWIVRIVGAG